MSSITSPNMFLVIPGVGTEAGPAYATDINTSLSTIDQHDHTAGKGVLITPAALNVNSALTLNNNPLTNIGALSLQTQTSVPSTLGSIYKFSNDLYYVDGLGANVQLTKNSAVAGTPGSIANLVSPASVTYVATNQTYVFQSNAGVAGNLDAGSILLRDTLPNSTFALSLNPPAALTSNYNINLPTLPASTKLLTMDVSGNIAAVYDVDNSTINIASNLIQVKPAGITPTQLAVGAALGNLVDNTVPGAKLINGTLDNVKRSPFTINSGTPGAPTYVGTPQGPFVRQGTSGSAFSITSLGPLFVTQSTGRGVEVFFGINGILFVDESGGTVPATNYTIQYFYQRNGVSTMFQQPPTNIILNPVMAIIGPLTSGDTVNIFANMIVASNGIPLGTLGYNNGFKLLFPVVTIKDI